MNINNHLYTWNICIKHNCNRNTGNIDINMKQKQGIGVKRGIERKVSIRGGGGYSPQIVVGTCMCHRKVKNGGGGSGSSSSVKMLGSGASSSVKVRVSRTDCRTRPAGSLAGC